MALSSPKFHGEYICGETELSIPVILRNTSDNQETTGVANGSVTAYYWRQGGSPVNIPMSALASLTTAYSAGGWYEVSSSNMPGLYRFDVPDAAVDDAEGVNWVSICVQVSGCYAWFRTITFESYSRTQLYSDLNNSTCGLQKLVRATDPTHTLNIDASGIADANLVEWNGTTPLNLTADFEPQVSIGHFSSAGLAEVTTGVEALLSGTNRTEPAVGAPPDDATILVMLQYLYMGFKNKLTSTNSNLKVHNKDGTELMQSTLSDDGTTFSRAKFVAP